MKGGGRGVGAVSEIGMRVHSSSDNILYPLAYH